MSQISFASYSSNGSCDNDFTLMLWYLGIGMIERRVCCIIFSPKLPPICSGNSHETHLCIVDTDSKLANGIFSF